MRGACRATDDTPEVVADVDGDVLYSSGPEYCRVWSVRNENELELSKDDEPEKDI